MYSKTYSVPAPPQGYFMYTLLTVRTGPLRVYTKQTLLHSFNKRSWKIRHVICAGWQVKNEQRIETFGITVKPCVLYVGGDTKVKKVKLSLVTHTPAYRRCRATAPYRRCRATAPYRRCRATGPYRRCRATAPYRRCRATAPYRRCRATGPYRRCRATAPYRRCRATGPYRRCRATGPYRRCRATAPYRRCRATAPYRRCRATAPYRRCRATGPYRRYRATAPLIINPGTWWRWSTSSPCHFTPRKELRYPPKKWLYGPQGRSGRCGEEKNNLPLPGFEPRNRPAHSWRYQRTMKTRLTKQPNNIPPCSVKELKFLTK